MSSVAANTTVELAVSTRSNLRWLAFARQRFHAYFNSHISSSIGTHVLQQESDKIMSREYQESMKFQDACD